MATQKDFRIKNGLIVQNGNTTVSQGTVSISDQISGDTGQLIITNGQLGDSFMRIGMIGSGTANSHIRTDSTLEFHIGQSATSTTPSVYIDTSGNLNITGNFQIDGVNRIVATSSYTEFRNPQGVTKLWLGGGSDGTSDPSAYINGNNFWIRDFNSTVNSVFSSSGLDIKRGDLKLNATTVIDASRNLSNIGTISSGAIDSTGDIQSDKFKGSTYSGSSFLDFDDDNGVDTNANTTTLASIGNMNFIVDTNGNGATDKFYWLKDNTAPNSATQLMDLDKNANLVLRNGTVTGQSGGFFGGDLELYNSSDLIIGSGGTFKFGTTVIVDSSRNLTNIGTISSGAITSSGVIESSGGDTATSGQLLNLHGSSLNQTNSGTIRLTEGSYDTSPFFQGGFIKYDGSGNQLKIGTHTASDSNLSNDIDAITIARSTGDTTFGQIIQSNRDIRSAGQIRATGWYNATASTDYTGMALEIGVSGTQPHILAYNRDTASYGNLVISSAGVLVNPRGSDFTIQGVVNLTSSGHLEIGSTTVIDSSRNLTNIGTITTTGDVQIGASNVAGNHALKVYHTDNYETAKFASNQLGSLARFTNSATSIEIGNQNGEAVLRTGSTIRLAANATGNVRVATGALQMGTTTVIDSSRNLQNIGTISNSAFTIPNSIGSAGQVLKVPSSGTTLEWGADTGLITGITNFADNRLLTASGSTTINAEADLTWNDVQLAFDSGAGSSGSLGAGGVVGSLSSDVILTSTNRLVLGQGGYGRIYISGSDINVSGNLEISGTQIINTARNMSNIGTISSGAITSSGAVSAEDDIHLTDGGTIRGKLLLNSSDRDNVELRAESLGSTMKFFTVGTQALELDASQNATFAGTVTSDGVSLPNLEVTSDSGNTVIDSSSSYLVLEGSNIIMRNRDGTEDYAKFFGNGAVTLYHNNSAKLATTSSGVQITGTLDVDVISNASGVVHLNDTLYFQDNSKAVFGDSSDLEIFHDGSNSNIVDTGTGYLSLRGTDLRLQDSTGWNFVICTDLGQGGEVALLHSNIQKLKTTSTGIDVTGTVKGDGLIINGGASSPTHLINGSRAGVLVSIDNESTSTSAGLLLNTASTNANSNILQVTSNDLDRFKVSGNGDISFYDDTGTTQALFWDASAESLGIGTTSPTAQIHLSKANGSLIKLGTSNNTSEIEARVVGGGQSLVLSSVNSADHLVIDGAGKIGIGTDLPSQIFTVENNSGIFRINTSTSTYPRIEVGSASGTTAVVINRTTSTQDIKFGETSDTGNYIFRGGNLRIENGSLQIGTQTVIDSSRNLTNIGTISSGNISSGSIIGTTITSVSAIGSADNVRSGLTHDDSSSMNIGVGGQLVLGYKYTSAGAYTEGAIIKMYKENAVSGEYGSGLKFQVRNHGANLSTKMTLDPSGNLLVGTTESNVDNNTTGKGIVLANSGYIQIAREATAQTQGMLHLNATGVDANMIEFKKDAVAVGAIGTNSGQLYIGNEDGSTDTGLLFGESGTTARAIIPARADGSVVDGALDLGYSSGRFKDLHLSGSTSTGDLKIGSTTVINGGRQLTNIASANVAGNITVDYTGNATNDAGIFIQNDNNDWGLRIQKTSTNSYGMQIRAGGDYVFRTLNSSGVEKFRIDGDGDIETVRNITSTGDINSSNVQINSNGIYLLNGNYRVGSTAIVDSSRNLINIGTISSGAITSSGAIGNLGSQIGQQLELGNTTTATLRFDADEWRLYSGGTGSSGEVFTISQTGDAVFRGNGNLTALGTMQVYSTLYTRSNLQVLNAAGNGWNTWATRSSGKYNLTNIGTISSGAITVTNPTANAPVATFTGNYTANGDVALSEWQRSGGAVKANFAYVDSTTDMEFGTTTSHGLGIKTGNTRRLTITSAGNATFTGTISSGAISINGTTVIDASRALTSINTITSGGLVRINASGSVSSSIKLLVGTTNSSSSSAIAQFGGFLRARDYIFLHDSSTLTNAVKLAYNGGHIDLTGGEGSNTAPATRVNSIASPDGTQLVFPNNSGKVGIGIASPSALVHAVSNDSTTNDAVNMMILTALSTGTTTTGFGPAILLQGERNNGVMQNVGRIRSIAEVNSGSNISSGLAFETSVAGVLNERLRISYDGHIGIGTDSHNVHSGTGLVVHATTGGSGNTGSPRIRLTNTTTGQSATDGAELSLDGNTKDFYIENREGQDIIFYSGSERSRIDTNGNLRITSGALQMGTTTVIDSSRNLTNIGSISIASVGSIGVINTNNLTIGGSVSNHSGLQFGTAVITPMRAGAESDAQIDIGFSNARFKDLYLSGEVETNTITALSTAQFDDTVLISGLLTCTEGALIRDAKSSASSPVLTVKNTSATNEGRYLQFLSSTGTNIGQIGHVDQTESNIFIATFSTGLKFESYITYKAILPCNENGADSDNAIDLGSSSVRFDDIYATNGTIQTSDRNQKQDIQALTDAEQRVATACKGLIRRFRWQDSVAEKDDNPDSDETARYHFGVIAQDLQDAFTAEGLDASDYGMFISSTWENDDGVEQTRLGVRYNELLSFIITTI